MAGRRGRRCGGGCGENVGWGLTPPYMRTCAVVGWNPTLRVLVGEVDQWRVRVGDWRVVYVIEDGRLVVVVVRVPPRGGV